MIKDVLLEVFVLCITFMSYDSFDLILVYGAKDGSTLYPYFCIWTVPIVPAPSVEKPILSLLRFPYPFVRNQVFISIYMSASLFYFIDPFMSISRSLVYCSFIIILEIK